MGSRSIATFRTDRLIAERLREEHLAEIQRMHRDPNVMATLGGLRSDKETARYLRENFGLDDAEALLDDVYARAGR